MKRQSDMEQLRVLLRSKAMLVCLRHWNEQTQQRRLAFEKALRKKEKDLELVSPYFER